MRGVHASLQVKEEVRALSPGVWECCAAPTVALGGEARDTPGRRGVHRSAGNPGLLPAWEEAGLGHEVTRAPEQGRSGGARPGAS